MGRGEGRGGGGEGEYERFKQNLSENVCPEESVIMKWVLKK
jgi:hypothetical protein